MIEVNLQVNEEELRALDMILTTLNRQPDAADAQGQRVWGSGTKAELMLTGLRVKVETVLQGIAPQVAAVPEPSANGAEPTPLPTNRAAKRRAKKAKA